VARRPVSQYQADVDKRRKLADGTLGAYADDFATQLKSSEGDTAKVALDRGLVTAIETRPRSNVSSKALSARTTRPTASTRSASAIPAGDRAEPVLGKHSDNKVAIVVASGEILDGYHPPARSRGFDVGAPARGALRRDVKRWSAHRQPEGASSPRRNLPGVAALRQAGSPSCLDEQCRGLGGYYIASGADQIYASAGTTRARSVSMRSCRRSSARSTS